MSKNRFCQCESSSKGFSELPVKVKQIVDAILCLGEGRFYLGGVTTGAETEVRICARENDEPLMIPFSYHGAEDLEATENPAKGDSCYRRELLQHDMRREGDEMSIPANVDKLAHELESLGYTYDSCSQSREANHILFRRGQFVKSLFMGVHIKIEYPNCLS